MENKYLTTSQAAAYLHVTRFTILNWVKSGKLKAVHTLGGHQRIPKESILRLIPKNKTVDQKPPDPQPAGESKIPCWKSKNANSSGQHPCSQCLVFLEQITPCFLAVKSFGPLKVRCSVECLRCGYLATYYPKERKWMQSLMPKAPEKIQGDQAKTNKADVVGLFKKGLYASGKYVALFQKKCQPGSKKVNRK